MKRIPSSKEIDLQKQVVTAARNATADAASRGDEDKPYIVLYLPGLEEMALGVARHLGDAHPVLCTSSIYDGVDTTDHHTDTGVAWESFPSGDPDIKMRVSALKDRHVVLLMNHDTIHLFEQLAVILFLQRFLVPHAKPEYAAGKWKKTVRDGAYDVCSVASLTILVPWYRHCQMERTSRWTCESGKWFNGKPDGEFVDVPTALSFATMLSALPMSTTPKSPAPPQQLLLVDIHECAEESPRYRRDDRRDYSRHDSRNIAEITL